MDARLRLARERLVQAREDISVLRLADALEHVIDYLVLERTKPFDLSQQHFVPLCDEPTFGQLVSLTDQQRDEIRKLSVEMEGRRQELGIGLGSEGRLLTFLADALAPPVEDVVGATKSFKVTMSSAATVNEVHMALTTNGHWYDSDIDIEVEELDG